MDYLPHVESVLLLALRQETLKVLELGSGNGPAPTAIRSSRRSEGSNSAVMLSTHRAKAYAIGFEDRALADWKTG